MKKALALFVVLCSLFAFAACEKQSTQEDSFEEKPSEENTEQYSAEEIKRYNKSVDALNRGGTFISLGDENELWDNDAMAYIYETFLNMPDYEDSAEYLSHFTVIPDVRVGEKWVKKIDASEYYSYETVDEYLNYHYDLEGRLVYYEDYQKVFEYPFGVDYEVYGYLFGYEDSGILSIIGVSNTREPDEMEGFVELYYDDRGLLISGKIERFLSSWGHDATFTYDIAYTYDDLDRVVRRTRTRKVNNEIYCAETNYLYDENGLLTQELYEHTVSGQLTDRKTTNYFYDTTGHIRQKTVRSEEDYWAEKCYIKTDIYDYTCDESGRILKEVLTHGDSIDENGHAETNSDIREITYKYDDYYIYDTTE